ncbi:MAG: domain containing protein [Frankiales bacterium]|nr:domain containing protein [Frankiales bacterium]
MSQLVTGEAVALDLREAALPSRLLAAFIDGLVQGGVFYFLVFVFLAVGAPSAAAGVAITIVLFLGTGLGYPVAMETLWRGKTLGKAAMGLRVVRVDSGPIVFRQAFVRVIIGLFVELPGITLYSAGVICSLVNSRGKRLGDLAAGTIVIQERVTGGTQQFYAVMPPPLIPWAQTLDLSGLPDDLALSVRSFLARAPQMSDASRADLGGRLAAAVGAVTAPPPPPGTPGWAYLTAILAERRRRAELAAVPVPPPSYAPAPPALQASPQPDPPAVPPEGGFHLPG